MAPSEGSAPDSAVVAVPRVGTDVSYGHLALPLAFPTHTPPGGTVITNGVTSHSPPLQCVSAAQSRSQVPSARETLMSPEGCRAPGRAPTIRWPQTHVNGLTHVCSTPYWAQERARRGPCPATAVNPRPSRAAPPSFHLHAKCVCNDGDRPQCRNVLTLKTLARVCAKRHTKVSWFKDTDTRQQTFVYNISFHSL